MKSPNTPLIVEQNYPVPPAQVWRAISTLEEMKQWYFENIPDFEATRGFKTSFLIENEGRKFTHRWEVTEVIPNELLSYEWTFDEYPGKSISHWKLTSEDSGTRLVLQCDVLEDFPQNIPEFKSESSRGGWEYFLGERLKAYLK